jgi:hypothetical protein
VRGIDLEPSLVEALNDRAAAAGVAAEAIVGDARALDLDETFALVLVPMQLLQVLAGREERVACLRGAAGRLAPGGRVAAAIVDGMPPELVEEAPPPLPDAREEDGWVYSSLPLDAALAEGSIVVRRLRQSVAPSGEMSEELDEVPLRLLAVEEVEAEAVEAGLEPVGRREIAPTETHVGSVVTILEAR